MRVRIHGLVALLIQNRMGREVITRHIRRMTRVPDVSSANEPAAGRTLMLSPGAVVLTPAPAGTYPSGTGSSRRNAPRGNNKKRVVKKPHRGRNSPTTFDYLGRFILRSVRRSKNARKAQATTISRNSEP
jgi:hypothetical protein